MGGAVALGAIAGHDPGGRYSADVSIPDSTPVSVAMHFEAPSCTREGGRV